MLNKEKIRKEIIGILIKNFKLKMKVDDFKTDNYVEEYGFNSIGIYESFILFEKKFKIVFDEDEISLENFTCMERLVELVFTKVSNK